MGKTLTVFEDSPQQGFDGFRTRLQAFIGALEHKTLDDKWEAAGEYLASYQNEVVATRLADRIERFIADGDPSPSLTTTVTCMLFSLLQVYNQSMGSIIRDIQARLMALVYVVPPDIDACLAEEIQPTSEQSTEAWERVQAKAETRTHAQALRALWVKKTDVGIEVLAAGIKNKENRAAGIRNALKRWQKTALREVFRTWHQNVHLSIQSKSVAERLKDADIKASKLREQLSNAEANSKKIAAQLRRLQASSVEALTQEVAQLNADKEATRMQDLQTGHVVSRLTGFGHTSHERSLRSTLHDAGYSPMLFMQTLAAKHFIGKTLVPCRELGTESPALLCHIVVLLRMLAPKVVTNIAVQEGLAYGNEAGPSCGQTVQITTAGHVGSTYLEVAETVMRLLEVVGVRVDCGGAAVLAADGAEGQTAREVVLVSLVLRVMCGYGEGGIPFEAEQFSCGWFTSKMVQDRTLWAEEANLAMEREQQLRTAQTALIACLVGSVCRGEGGEVYTHL